MRADALPPEVERELAAIDAALAGRPVDPDLADLAELAADLRAERAAPPPAFAADLDRRVAAGFPSEPGRLARWRARRSGFMPALAFAATLLVALVIAVPVVRDRSADGPGGGSVTLDAPESAVPPGAEDSATTRGGGGGAAAPEIGAAPGAPPPSLPSTGQAIAPSDELEDRQVERSASMTLAAEPERLEGVADGIVRTADALGGFVVSSSVTSGDGRRGGGGTFELRVPSDQLGQALARLSRLAHVRERAQATRDITAEGVSARERLREARAERRSLLRRLERADSDEETEAVRRRLRLAEARIRAARGDLARVDNRAAFSTIVVTLVADAEDADGGASGTWSPGDAARDALRVLEVALGVAMVGLAALLPLGLLAALGMAAGRRIGHRRRERALDMG